MAWRTRGRCLACSEARCVIAAAQQVETALQAAPTLRGKANAASPGVANHAPQFGGIGIEHSLIGQAHQEAPGDAVPERAAGLDDAASAQLQKARQHTSRKFGARGISGFQIGFD